MRILIANDTVAGAGGVETYLACLLPALEGRGHEIGVVHQTQPGKPGPTTVVSAGTWQAGAADEGIGTLLDRVRAWRPDVVFSHNMASADLEAGLAATWPVVKMMHGYFGTCISGHKAVGNGDQVPCDRVFGGACLALYLPVHCGQRRPLVMMRQYRWAVRQRRLFASYRAMVVASTHMRREYVRNGVAPDLVHSVPLFAPNEEAGADAGEPRRSDVLFMGRLTPLKGPVMLVHAVAHASRALGRAIELTIAGEGPLKAAARSAAEALGVCAELPGWVSGADRLRRLRGARVLAMPSRWPEPFGLAGLEAARYGIPSVAFDVGGISEWLHHDASGRLVNVQDGARGLGDALAAVLGDASLRERLSSGASKVARTMSLDAHVDAIEPILERASANRP